MPVCLARSPPQRSEHGGLLESKVADRAPSMLKKADENFKLEKQMTATPLPSDGKISPPVPQ